MSGFDWERKGPPRPASGSVDHPRGIERPIKVETERDREERNAERREEYRIRKERGLQILLHDIKARAAEMRARLAQSTG